MPEASNERTYTDEEICPTGTWKTVGFAANIAPTVGRAH